MSKGKTDALAELQRKHRALRDDYNACFAMRLANGRSAQKFEQEASDLRRQLADALKRGEETGTELSAAAGANQGLAAKIAEITKLHSEANARVASLEKRLGERDKAIIDLKTEVAELTINLARARGYIDRANEDDEIARAPSEDVPSAPPRPPRSRRGPDVVAIGRTSQAQPDSYGRPRVPAWYER